MLASAVEDYRRLIRVECGRKGNWEHAWSSSWLVSLMKLKCYVFSVLSGGVGVCMGVFGSM